MSLPQLSPPIDFRRRPRLQRQQSFTFYLRHLRRFAQDTSLVAPERRFLEATLPGFCWRIRSKGLSSQLAVTCAYLLPPPNSADLRCATEKPKICLPQAQDVFSNCSPDLKKRRWRSSGTEFSVFIVNPFSFLKKKRALRLSQLVGHKQTYLNSKIKKFSYSFICGKGILPLRGRIAFVYSLREALRLSFLLCAELTCLYFPPLVVS